MTIPAVPGANLVVIETNFTFANFKALLNAPASTNCFCHLDKRCTGTSKDQKERLIWRFGSRGGDALSDDQPMLPSFCFRTAEFNPHPVIQSWSFRSIPYTVSLPLRMRSFLGEIIHTCSPP